MNKSRHTPLPPAKFRIAPFWFLNHALTPDEMRRQVALMHEAGLGGFFMHARYGRLTPYLSEEWMRNIAAAVEEAKRRRMWAWLYDEDNWPSGSAGGAVGRQFPSAVLSLKSSIRPERREARHLTMALAENEMFFHALLRRKRQGGSDEFSPAAGNVSDGTVELPRPAPGAELLVFTVLRHYGQPDLLHPRAGRLFVKLTHAAYKKKFGREFGKTVAGSFFDEPWFTRHDIAHSKTAFLPWTDGIETLYKKRFARDLRQDLPFLFLPLGAAAALPRRLFHSLVSELFVQNFFRPIHEFCRKHRLLSIGHLPGEDRLDYHVYAFGDFFAVHRHTDWPGTDTLWGQLMPEEGNGLLNNCVSCKMAASAAHVLRKERVMSEEFGCAHGWKFSLREMKPLHDMHVGLGVNYIIPHGFYYSLQGFRKWECIPSHFFHQPYWPFYKAFAEHSERMCALFSETAHEPDVAILYPLASMRAAAPASGLETPGRITKKDFEDTSLFTLKAQRDFDYLPEQAVQQAEVRGNRLTVNRGKGRFEERFSAVILPAVTDLEWRTWEKLLAFCRSGGTLIFTSLLPLRTSEGCTENKNAARDAAALFHLNPEAVYERAIKNAGDFDAMRVRVPETGVLEFDHSAARRLRRAPQNITAVVGKGKAVFLPDFFRLTTAHKAKRLREALEQARPAFFEFKRQGADAEMLCFRYRRPGYRLLFLMNTSDKPKPQFSLRVAAEGYPVLVDTEHGGQGVHLTFAKKEGGVEFALDFGPRQARVVLLHRRQPAFRASGAATKKAPVKTIVLSRLWRFKLEQPNTLPLTRSELKFELGAKSFTTISQDNVLVFQFRAEYSLPEWFLVLDGLLRGPDGKPHTQNVIIELNGSRILDYPREARRVAFGSRWDPAMEELRFTVPFRRGVNTLKITSHEFYREPVALTQPPIIAGDFSVTTGGALPAIRKPAATVKTGSWADQGYPFYSGKARYEQDFIAPAAGTGKTLLKFEAVAEALEVILNGKPAGAAAWPPFEFDISEALKPGRNRLSVRVANTLENRFSVRPQTSGILGEVRLEYFT